MLDLTSTRLVARLLLENGVDLKHLPRAAWCLFRSLPGSPLRYIDRISTWPRMRRTTIEQPPLFIIGHWRSGTTHLHNLLSQDPRFGLLSTYHCITPHSFLILPQRAKRWVENSLPEERPMDGVRLSAEAPQEEELAMARISHLSLNHAFTFPRRMRPIFERSVLFEGANSTKLIEQWKARYVWLLKRLTIDQQGRPLCLKNPANTARIRQLLELFPNAKFVHIYRNPYVVFRSTVHMWNRLLGQWSLQQWDTRELDENVLYFYRRLMQRYFEDVSLIPAGHLTEVRFEDLEVRPMETVARVYRELSLDGFQTARPRIEEHLRSLGEYRKNEYALDAYEIERVRRDWSFALERWDYDLPEGIAVPSRQLAVAQ
jgi:hypothetical protein